MVRKAMSKVKGSYVVSTPKTSTSRRVVQMPPFLEEELSSLVYAKGTAPDKRIFPFTHHRMRRHLKEGAESAGLPRSAFTTCATATCRFSSISGFLPLR